MNSIQFLQFRHKSDNPLHHLVTNIWRGFLLVANKCSQPKYDTAVFIITDTESWTKSIVDIRFRRYNFNVFMFLQRSSDLCNLQKLRSTDDQGKK